MKKAPKVLSTFLVREKYTVEVKRHVRGKDLTDARRAANEDEGYEAVRRYATNVTLEERITETT